MKEKNEDTDPASENEAIHNTEFTESMSENTTSEPDEPQEDEEAPKQRKKPRVPKLYPGARKDFYPTCTLMWNSCQANLDDFTLFSGSYDEDLITERKELITTVRAMPDETERSEPHRTAREGAEKACSAYCNGWQGLKRYIERAKFESEEAKLDLAGQKLYYDASKFEWSISEALVLAGDKFTASHLAALTANLNMPATFPAALTALGEAFNAKLAIFRNFEIATEELTDAKMAAENDLYEKTIEMGKDGQYIYKKEAAKARLFSFAAMLETVSGVGSASLVGTALDDGNEQPIGNMTVTLSGKGLSGTTTATGKYSIKRVSSGTYSATYTAPGYQPVTISGIVVEPATAKRVNVKLVKA